MKVTKMNLTKRTDIKDKFILEDILSITESTGPLFDQLSGKKILITGANGFINSYFADTVLMLNSRILEKNPAKLILLTRSSRSRLNHCLESPNIQFVTGDLLTVDLPKNIDIIIHGASKASPKEYLNQLVETADVNVLGTKKLLEYAIKNKSSKFLLLSSGEIYGDAMIFPTPETYAGNVDPIGPRSAYQESKRFAEALCSIYAKSYGTNAVIARLFHTFGPRLSLEDGRVIPEFIRRALNKEDLEVTDTKSIRTFAYISDSIEALWRILLLGKPGEAYNVGSEEEIEIKNLARLILKITKNPGRIIERNSIPHSIATPSKSRPDIQKIKALGHINKISLSFGLKRLVYWYHNNQKKAP